MERAPDQKERKRIAVLRKAAEEILGDLILVKKWPDCRILLNKNAPVAGYTKVSRYKGEKNKYGLQVAAQADFVYLQSWILGDALFSRAFSTYAHELLHEYGGDSSSSFHKALFLMNMKIIENIDRFFVYEEEWKSV